MRAHFNIYHFFAGAFVPAWLLARQELSAGAKLTYALLAQQANSRGATQLNFNLQGAALGADEGQLARHLMDLEEVGLVQVARGNVQAEDIRVFIPRHSWMTGLEPVAADDATSAAGAQAAATTPRLFPEDARAAQSQAARAAAQATGQHPREGRGRRRRRKPQSKHSFEVCLRFVTVSDNVGRQQLTHSSPPMPIIPTATKPSAETQARRQIGIGTRS
jgi:hypothetical protein